MYVPAEFRITDIKKIVDFVNENNHIPPSDYELWIVSHFTPWMILNSVAKECISECGCLVNHVLSYHGIQNQQG